MTREPPIPETMTLHVPFRIVKRGGRKEMQLPHGVRPDRRTDNTLVKALARAFRWKLLLESGDRDCRQATSPCLSHQAMARL